MLNLNNFKFQIQDTGELFTVPGQSEFSTSVTCALPEDPAVTLNRTSRALLAYDVSVSHDGGRTSGSAAIFSVYSHCVTCDVTTGRCEVQEDSCLISGRCLSARHVNEANFCEMCLPDLSRESWSFNSGKIHVQ